MEDMTNIPHEQLLHVRVSIKDLESQCNIFEASLKLPTIFFEMSGYSSTVIFSFHNGTKASFQNLGY